MKRISTCILTVLLLAVTLVSNNTIKVEAADRAMLYVTGYEVTNETITPGEDFVLTLKLENYSELFPADNVIISISNPDGVLPEYGSVSTVFIESIGPGEVTEIKFNYSANPDIVKTELNFNVGVVYDTSSSSAQLRIPVGRMTDFETDSKNIPQKMYTGKTNYASAQVKNVGNTAVSNAVMIARSEGVDIAATTIGSIPARTVKTQYVGITFYTPGKQAVDLLLKYTDGDGNDKEYVIASGIITVTDEEQVTVDNTTDTLVEDINTNEGIVGAGNVIVLSVSGVLLIGVCCLILVFVYRRK